MAKKAVKRQATPKKAATPAAAASAAPTDKDKKPEKTEPEKAEKPKADGKGEPPAKVAKIEKEAEKIEKKVEEKKVEKKAEKVESKEEKAEAKESEDAKAGDAAKESAADGSAEAEGEENAENADESGESAEKKNERAESPLNILIGEEEENLLLNSGDDGDATEQGEKNEEAGEKGEGKEEGETKQEEGEGKDGEEKEKSEATAEAAKGEEATPAADGAKTEEAKAADDKSKNNKSSQQGRSLWVTNLLPSTRAQELKHLLSRYGKVIGAKIVQSSRHPRTRCYGYVTMETRAAADHCIKKLNNTELKGQIIRVAKVRPEHSLPLKSVPESTDNADKSKTSPGKQDEKKDDKSRHSLDKKSVDGDKKKDKESRKGSKDREHTSRSSSRKDRAFSEKSGRSKRSDVLTFDKIREERDRHRARERERAAREEEKRRREIQRSREIERRQREEAQRLEREREKLRLERERLDRQRQEILRLERERQKLEREKLEQEKQELRRQQMRLEEARRPIKRPASTSSSNYRREATGYPDDRKREAREDRHYEEAPPPPRFEVPARDANRDVSKKEMDKDYKQHMPYPKHSEEYKRGDYKREFPASDRHYGSGGHMVHPPNNGGSAKYESGGPYVNRERDMREPDRRDQMAAGVGPPKISSEVRYNGRPGERSPTAYRGPRGDDRERRPMAEHHGGGGKGEMRSRDSRDHRYGEPVGSMKEGGGGGGGGGRYRGGDGGNSWHGGGGPSPTQPFGGMGGPNNSSREWSKSDNWRPMEPGGNDRWVGNSSSRMMMSGSSGVPGPMYGAGNSSGMSCPPPPGSGSYAMDRFDNYKSISNARKY